MYTLKLKQADDTMKKKKKKKKKKKRSHSNIDTNMLHLTK